MERVSVNKGLLIGVVAVAAASVLALAFILGRASGSGSPSEPQRRGLPSDRADPSVTRPQGLPRQVPTLPLPTSAAVPITVSADTRPAEGPTPPSGDHERESPVPESAQAEVAAYFDAVDHIQPGKMSGDAEGVAHEMAAALAGGDTSDLDRMIRETEAAKESFAAIRPPASCVAHHRESLGSLDDALEMLRSLKSAMGSPDSAARLTGVATRAAALRSRSEALQKDDLALRRRYGLTR